MKLSKHSFNYKLIKAMLSTFTKKIIGLQKTIKPYLHVDSHGVQRLIIYKGYEPHFQWFQANHSQIREKNRIYCFDRCSIDVALEMSARKTHRLSYISTRNYQTVEAINRNQKQTLFSQQQQTAKVDKRRIDYRISEDAKGILKNCDFILKSTYLDIHPLEAYQKLCGYLMAPKNKIILNRFEGFKCVQANLFQSFLILPLVQQTRNKYLVVDELKLQQLKRKSQQKIPDQQINSILQQFCKITQLNIFQNASSSFEDGQKIDWVISNNLGEQVTKRDLLNQKYRRYSYAMWI